MPTNYTQSTTQEYLDIYDITNNLVVMKDGSTSMILTVDAMNFGLLAEEEQDAVMYAYAGLLNSLNYPIQVIVKSQTKDVTSYLQRLKEQEIKASSRLNQERIGRYREFVSNLIRERNVLDKKFYVVIPATAIELGIVPASSVLPGKQSFNAESVDKPVLLEKAQTVLEPKRDHIVSQFARIGLYSRQLETQEIIQLFYVSYNPEAAEGQQLGETQSYASPLVSTFSEEVAVPEVVPVSEEPVGEVPISQSQPEADPALAQVSGATVNPDSLRQLTDRHDEAEIDMTSNNQPQPEANPPLAEITTLVDKSTDTQPEVMGEMSTSPQQSDEKIPPPTIPKAIFSGPTSAPSTDEVQTQIYSDLAQT
ncbi:hypothetical protein KC686_02165, partial [Candidatus Woesebacteria bacterium]|nr:hypothetical protein [Candidatus Woesebacteria bacterium]